MNKQEQKVAAEKFAAQWKGHGYEKGETQKFWLDLLSNVLGVQNATSYIIFEEQVKSQFQGKTVTQFIDAFIPETRVMIEQKSSGKSLTERIKQSDGTFLTPFEQAKKYIAGLPVSQHPKWIITCNFDEFLVYDMEHPNDPPEQIFLKDFGKDFYRLDFLVSEKAKGPGREVEVSLKAGELVGKLYDALFKQYIDPDENSFRSLNILCVRIVFCLYAEDAGLFESRTSFEDYVRQFSPENLRKALQDLFCALDTKLPDRDKYETRLKPFPYVNGGLFHDGGIEIPNFTEEIVKVLTDDCATFDWSEISPTIFGAVFESTLNAETRRNGGMHYTSIENIHKVIDPLFMDSLNAEFAQILKTTGEKSRTEKLLAFQTKLASLKFFDPACGSGNFLTETYTSLRRLENKILKELFGKQVLLGDVFDPVKVSIENFYGIEINDFAVTVARTALWIAESQTLAETSSIVSHTMDFLPLKTSANIVEGNSLRLDWETVVPKAELSYIIGNPPFVGARLMGENQKQDMLNVFGNKWKNVGNLDYVGAWYKKSADLMFGTGIRAALVSTNSISQGEQVANLWEPLFERSVHIDFAYRTFRWDSEASQKAHVHCVIVGFSCGKEISPKLLFGEKDSKPQVAENINAYLMDAPNVFVGSRQKPLCNVPEIGIGNQPIDDGNYLFDKEEKDAFIQKEPKSAPYFHPWYGAYELIHQEPRYCLWLGDCSPKEINAMPRCKERVQKVREFRLSSKRASTLKLADSPTRFQVENMPKGNAIIVPSVSSEKRSYVPMGFIPEGTFASNLVLLIPSASLYHFGILESSVHMAWMRAVCGRLEMRYRYSKDVVYNNFPWPVCGGRWSVAGDRSAAENSLVNSCADGGSNENSNLQGFESLASSDVCSSGDLQSRQKTSERRNLCVERSNAQGGGLDSVEHCRGTRSELNSGISAVPEHSARLDLRTRNAALAERENSAFDANRHSPCNGEALVHRETAQRPDQKAPQLPSEALKQATPQSSLAEGRNSSPATGHWPLATRTTSDCEPIPHPLSPNHYDQITATAQAILNARAKYPDSSLADLYDPVLMPQELRKAHADNDRAVLAAYGLSPKLSEEEIVAELFKLYQKLAEDKA